MNAKNKLQAIHTSMLEVITKADDLAAQMRPHRRTTAGTMRAYNAYIEARQQLAKAKEEANGR